MSTTWILVANASVARLFANHGPKKGLQLVKEFKHPESREKGLGLASDRAGHMQNVGNGHGSRQPTTDPKEYEAERFALELAKELEHGRTTNSFKRLILVVSAPFLGMLNSNLSSHLDNLISDRVEKDYTSATEKDLAGYLEHCIYL